MKENVFRLEGKMQHYAWGGYNYIPDLLGLKKQAGQPCAEYWMGAHPSASSVLHVEGRTAPLYELISSMPDTYIGKDVFEKFGELPYLFKILDVKDMLSIQVHPSREEAAKGFDAEEAAGVPLGAPHRNYKDMNHKPEVMVALSEFWLLHGFKVEALLQQTLEEVPELAFLIPVFAAGGYRGLYREVMEMKQADVDSVLLPLVARELESSSGKDQPGYWVRKLYPAGRPAKDLDRGIFSIYFFNIVGVQPGEAVFQGAGIPHAYLEGQNAELMANSDNVLRGGLTPKHVDVTELLKHTSFEGIVPGILKGNSVNENEKTYPCPVEDFAISAVRLPAGATHRHKSDSPEIYIVIEGAVSTAAAQNFQKGESFFISPKVSYTLTAQDDTLMYKAFLPQS